MAYKDNPKALVELPKTVVAADVTDNTKWYMEIGFITDPNLESGKILMSELVTLIDTDTTATASNVGAGTGLIFKQKTGIDLEFKSLIAGANITINNNASDIEIIAAGGGGTRIENGATTTFVDTDLGSYSNQVVVGSSLLTTGIIFTAQSDTGGTPADVFQIDGNGNLFNNNLYRLAVTTGRTIIIGTNEAHAGLNYSSATENIFIGDDAGRDMTTGDYNVLIGQSSGRSITTGNYNVCLGRYAGLSMITTSTGNTYIGSESFAFSDGLRNTGLGFSTGRINDGSDNVFIGYVAGQYQTATSSKFILDNQDRTNAAGELTDSLIVGDFHATPASQTLTFNAFTTSTYHFKQTGSIKAIDTHTVGLTTLTTDHYHNLLDASGGNVTLRLPALSATNNGTIYVFGCIDSSSTCAVNTVTGGDAIGYTGATTSISLVAGNSRTFQADNASKRWIEIL